MSKNIIVTGNTCKSVFSYYLAKILPGKIVVVSTDMINTPDYTLFFDNTNRKSLGKVLEKPRISKQDVFSQMYFPSDNLSYLAYSQNDMLTGYPEAIEENCIRLLDLLSDTADYVIFDTQNKFSLLEKIFYLQNNTIEINVTSADRRGIAYRNKFENLTGCIYVLIETNKYSNASEIASTFTHPPKYIIPYVKHLTAVHTAVPITAIKTPKEYKRIISRLTKEELLC